MRGPLIALLGLLVAATLQGAVGEQPSEYECRPYIEKALKENQGSLPASSHEDAGSSEQDADDLEMMQDAADQGDPGASTEDQTETASVESGEATDGEGVIATEGEGQSSEEENADGDEEGSAEKSAEGGEASSEEGEGPAEAGETSAEDSTSEGGEASVEGGESAEGTTEAEGSTETTESESSEEGAAEGGESIEGTEGAESIEGVAEGAESLEEGTAEGAESVGEGTAEGESLEDVAEGESTEGTEGVESIEEGVAEGAESVEEGTTEGAESVEEGTTEGADSLEEGTAEGVESVEEGTAEGESLEEGAAEGEGESAEGTEVADSVEEGTTEGAESVEEETTEGESLEEGAAEGEEESAEGTEGAESVEDRSTEGAESVEEGVAAEGVEGTESLEEGTAEEASKEEGAVEGEAESQGEDSTEGGESLEEGATADASSEEGTDAGEASIESTEEGQANVEEGATGEGSIEEGTDAGSSEETPVEGEKAAAEDGSSEEAAGKEESVEEDVVSRKPRSVGEEAVTDDTASDEGEPSSEAQETADEEAEEAATVEETPEEELSYEVEIPENLRPREHISQILRLDEDSVEDDVLVGKSIEATLKELKRYYDSAIKPLEILYKYRDLSNRHFGDPEIFSKPLILFMGPWSGGKSSIINYLLDNEYKRSSLRTGAEPSPAYFNILMWGDREEVLDGTQLAADWTFSGLQKFGQGLLDRLRGLRLNNRLLEKVNIVEIPGILEIRKQVERVFPFNDACQWFIDRADIIFLVYDPAKLDVGPETEAILDQLKGREYQTRILLNKADQVRPEELMRVQGTLIWNISPLMSSTQPPVMYSASLWSMPYESGAPLRLLRAQERAFLRDMREAIDKRVENKIASARRFAVRVRNHAKMVDCYLTTYYNHKSFFGNRKQVADDIIDKPQNYHIYEGLSTLTNISRYDLPDPETYRDFFRVNPLYEFQQLAATCTYFKGCPINRLDVAIAYDLPELVGRYKKAVEAALTKPPST